MIFTSEWQHAEGMLPFMCGENYIIAIDYNNVDTMVMLLAV